MKRFFYLFLIFILFICNSAIAGESSYSMYARAYGHIYRNNSKEAVRIFEKAQSIYPDCAFLYAGMGDAYLKMNNFNKALDCYTIAQKKKYSNPNYKIDFYNAHLKKSAYEISQALNEIIATTKISDNAMLFKNINYILNENYAKTGFILEIYSNSNDITLTDINNYKQQGQAETALRRYLKLAHDNPKNFQAANNAAVTLYELKDYQLAEKYLNIALENNPQSALILNNLAVIKLYLKKYAEAEKNIEQAISLNKTYAPAINNKFVIKIHKNLDFYKSKNVESIIDIINQNNENYYAIRTLAKIYFFKGSFHNADNLLEHLNSTYNFKLYIQKGYTSFKNNDYKTALNYINKSISLYSDNSENYLIRARIYEALGNYDYAQVDFQKALAKDKKNYIVYYYNARMLYNMNDKQRAEAMMKNFISLKKGNEQSSQLKLLFN